MIGMTSDSRALEYSLPSLLKDISVIVEKHNQKTHVKCSKLLM